jgi:enoyl-CoA hydratase
MPEELLYDTDGAVATITLNRPERLNAVTPELIERLDAALARAQADQSIRVIRLRGAGRAFCAGYDLTWAAALMRDIDQGEPWDPMEDYANLSRFVRSYMSLWNSPKPVVAQVHGVCVGGGSDLALCSDLIVCADDCRIGYPPARIWGSPTTAMWFYRLGLERAKRLLLTGDAMDGRTAVEWGFASGSYPAEQLDTATMALCRRIALIPANQLRMMKLLVNNAVEQLGLASTQLVGTLLDGSARHTPQGTAFSAAAADNLAAAVAARDEPFGDYRFGSRTVADSLLDLQPNG